MGEIRNETIRVLQSYPWPGNVRQLENAMLRATILSNGTVIVVSDLPTELLKSRVLSLGQAPTGHRQRKHNHQKFELFLALTKAGDVSAEEIRERVGIYRPTYYRWLGDLD